MKLKYMEDVDVVLAAVKMNILALEFALML